MITSNPRRTIRQRKLHLPAWFSRCVPPSSIRSEEHTSELSHLGISYAVFCLEKKSTRLKSSHLGISYAVFCLEKNSSWRSVFLDVFFVWYPSPLAFLSFVFFFFFFFFK